ncbi:hypothetical protein dsat_0900 [Alkalidesulfovibrio alkalitolerans DSM 16529]|jgi:hypothetical protein|uniref:Uncharacterized protein n=1 Tax=Alkalidesulfovibrio alkalitolerans DSM 16529 TaxID=1121439 RepID=S7T4M9_9BACT|nr:hypothetical protein [Alkalidesulfovibrio alkalitolerans]EPR31576.1 hypothetical protein dsat_0900 [Alkalidesulfovibrio alkalitolerans DSM 16529]
MSETQKPVTPVKPTGLELIYLYACPFCGREVPVISPTSPAVAKCDACRKGFPIVPVDERTVRYIKLMLHGGSAGIDPDFL